MPRYHSTGRCRSFLAGSAIAILLAIFAVPNAAFAADKAKLVTVVTTESKFTPNKLSFRRGIPYRLHVENHGKEMHEFTAPEFFKSVALHNPEVLNADKVEAEIPPGQAKDIFLVPQRAGHYDLRCSDHDWAGMTGAIVVK